MQQYNITIMSQTKSKERQKITLTQLQRYLPLLSPTYKWDLPLSVIKYLSSPSFNNFSLKEQNSIKYNYDIAYRNYFSIERIVKHLNQLTRDKFTLQSLQQTVRNCAQKYQLIDWFLFNRIVSGKHKHFDKKSSADAVSFIASKYRIYRQKKKVLLGQQEVEVLKKSLQERLIVQFGKEALHEIKEVVDKNRIQMEKNLKAQQIQKKMSYVKFQFLINSILEIVMESKKVKYLYLRYDFKNYGTLQIEHFLSQVFTERKPIQIQVSSKYLISSEQIMDFVRSCMTQQYYGYHQLLTDYNQKYHQKYAQYYGQTVLDASEINQYDLYHFLKDKCQNRLSFLQTKQVHQQLQYIHNIQFLFVKPNIKELASHIFKFTMKKERKKMLKKEHQNYYSFKKIILYIISKSKMKKLTRAEFNKFIIDLDPSLKYNAFYCVWRVYGQLINVERMKKECNLNPLACYFKLNKSEDDYQKIIQNLLDAFPEGAEVPYSKVQQKINLYCEFVLDNQQIKPLSLGDYDLVDYQKCISQILPLDFDIIIRAYIFKKIAEKFMGIWRGIQIKKEHQKKKQELIDSILSKAAIVATKGKIIDQLARKQPNKRLLTNKSNASLQSKVSKGSKKQINPQSFQIVKAILYNLFENISDKQIKLRQKLDSQVHFKKQLILTSEERYTYRSYITRGYFHHLLGILGMSKQFIQLKQNHHQKIDIKIPYKPNIQVIDFVIWNNNIAILTSYNIIQIYALGQSNNYPIRTIQFDQTHSNHNISVKLYDQICSQRFMGKYPILMKPHQHLLMINLLHSKQISLIDQDTTIEPQFIPFNFKEHFFPEIIITIFKALKDSSHAQKSGFIQNLLAAVTDLKNSDFSLIHVQRLEQCLKGVQVLHSFTKFDYRQLYDFLTAYSSSIVKCILKTELNLKQKYHLPSELKQILKLLIQYMKQNNFSLHQIIMQITKSQQQMIALKQFKNYLLKITYQLYVMYQKQIDKFLKNISNSKYIQYSYLADIVGYNWNYQILQKPFLLIHNFIIVPEFSIVIYTLQGFNQIFVKHLQTHVIVAKFIAHFSTPIIHYIPQSMILVSSDSKRIGKQQKPQLCVWRIYQDMISCFNQNPPWKVSPFYRYAACHDESVTSINYLSRCHILVTTSLDSTLKFWSIQSNPFGLLELKRVYSNDFFYLSTQVNNISLQNSEINLQFLLVNKISKQISTNNVYRYQTTLQLYLIELIKVKIKEEYQYFDVPVRTKQFMKEYGEKLSKKKKILLAKKCYEQIKSLNKAKLMLQSLDKNIYNSLKNAYIFQSIRQLRSITDFLGKNQHSEMIVRNVCEQYGLDLIKEMDINQQSLNSLALPPQLPLYETEMKSNVNQLYFPLELIDQIFQKINKNSSNSNSLIELDTLYRIMEPYLYGDYEAKFNLLINNYLQQTGKANASILTVGMKQSNFSGLRQSKTSKLVQVKELRKIIQGYQIKGELQKFNVSIRSLLLFLKEKHLNIWEIFSVNRKELEKFKKIRTNELTERLTQLGFNKTKIMHITNYLSKNGNISLFEFIHYAKIAKQQANPSQLMPNYSSLILSVSKVFESNHKSPHMRLQGSQMQSSLAKSVLQNQLQDMMKKKIQKIQEQSQSGQRSRTSSLQKVKQKDSIHSQQKGMINSNSKGSLSKDITFTKDLQKKQAYQIMRKLRELLKNQNKSFWQIIALSIPQFIHQPIITETQYFSIFQYLKTPFLLSQKLKLLNYIKRQSNNQIDINVLFQLTEYAQKPKPQGEKYIISYIMQNLQYFSTIFDQALQICFFSQKQQVFIDDLVGAIAKAPFNCCNFVLRQFQLIFLQDKRLVFTISDVRDLIVDVIEKFKLKFELNKVTFLNDLIFKIEKKGLSLQDIFPKHQKVNLHYFVEHANTIYNDPTFNPQQDFKSIVYSVHKQTKKDIHQMTLKYNEFIKQLERRMGMMNQNQNKQLQICKKLLKHLQNLKLTLFQFFVMIDRNKKFHISQQQLQIGLVEINIYYDLWSNIPKKHPKKLTYYQFVSYLIKKNILAYKSIDSQIQIAMEKFIKRFMRNDDIQVVYNRLKGDSQTNEVNFQQFKKVLKMVNYFKEEQIIYLFSMLVNESVVKNAKFGNDDLIKDVSNLGKTFNYKKFIDIISVYRSDNIMKTPQYRFYDYIKKRNVSLIFQFKKWLEKNKKIKEIAEAMKSQTVVLKKETFLLFLNQIKAGLNQKQLKQLLAKYKDEIDFNTFYNQLQGIYKKGNINLQKQEVECYLHQIIKKITKMNVTLQRLFNDFSHQKGMKMYIHQFTELCNYLTIGFNKIQIKKIFAFMDKQKKGYMTYSELMDAAEDAQKVMEKDEEDYKFDYIIQKLMNNTGKYVLKNSKISFNAERARIIFESILSKEQSILLYSQLTKDLKKEAITQKQMQDFLLKKIFEFKLRCDKKDKDMIIKLLNYLKKINIEIEQIYSYMSHHSSREQIKKQQFIVLYQTLQLKNNLMEINSLYNYLDDAKKGFIVKSKWDDKLNMIYLQQQIQINIQNEDLKLFYKVKLFLSEIFLIFIRKSFKNHQIYHYFDRHSNGIISYDQLISSLNDLSVVFEQDMSKKIINYLDKNRQHQIRVGNLLIQLQNCLGSKMRLILQTKTSHLFKQKSKIFQQKSQYFINQLASRQQLIQINGLYKSCILSFNFTSLLKQFGCLLTEDQIQDIHKNYVAKQNYLFLYPIYQTFVNLFKERVLTNMQAAQSDRYKRFMMGLIKHNYTISDLSKLGTYKQLYNFIEQLGIFTPIDIKLIIEANLYQYSSTIDIESLKQKIKNSYLTKQNQQINNSFIAFARNSQTELRKQLKEKINVHQFIKIIGASQGKINLQTFQNTLVQMNVVVTKGIAKKYFQAFSQGHQFMEIHRLVQAFSSEEINQSVNLFGKTAMSLMGKLGELGWSNFGQQNEMLPIEESVDSIEGCVMIGQHAVKSLNFKGISLDGQFNKFYYKNYGFVKYVDVLTFFSEIGIDNKVYHKQIAQIFQIYSQLTLKKHFNKEQLIKTQHFQSTLIYLSQKLANLQQTHKLNQYTISSIQLNTWITTLTTLQSELGEWLNQNKIYDYHITFVYQFFAQKHANQQHLVLLFVKQIPVFVRSYQSLYQWVKQLQQKISQSQQIQSNISKNKSKDKKQILTATRSHFKVNYLHMFISKNPIKTYQIAISTFAQAQLTPSINNTNIQRLAINLTYEYILNNKFLFQINANLIQPQSFIAEPLQLVINPVEVAYNLKALGSLTIDQEEQIDRSGLVLINKKYYGLAIAYKYQFQNIATVAHVFDPTAIFLKTRNYYLWEPNQEPMFKTAINYRWKYLPVLAKQILQQMAKVHSLGFCLPHLRWQHLNRNKLIDRVVYPCPIDKNGKIKGRTGFNSLKYEDAYCCPQFYRMDEKTYNFKCDSWIFGCILYQFMYGHAPQSFLMQLKKYLNDRHITSSIGQVLSMPELPYQFNYIFYSSEKLNKLFNFQHHLKYKCQSNYTDYQQLIKREQSFKGILLNLQMLYGTQYKFYKDQFKIIQQLNNIVYECLQVNHQNRPTIQNILGRKIFEDSYDLVDYNLAVKNHINAEQFYISVIQPVQKIFSRKSNIRNCQQVVTCLKYINANVHLLTSSFAIPQHLIIPKYYPWPNKSKGIYSQNILSNRQRIRATSNFNVLTLFFNSRFIQMTLMMALQQQNQTRAIMLDQILNLLGRLLLSFKQYSNASCGFVINILDALLKIIYEQTKGILNEGWIQQIEIEEQTKHQMLKQSNNNKKHNYLQVHNFEGIYQKRSLAILNSIVYLNGQGNIEYLPIKHYLQQNTTARQLLQNIYCHVKLMSNGGQSGMMINYFRDRIIDNQKFKIQLQIKIEVDMMIYLTDRQNKMNVLGYFKDMISTHDPSQLQLFKHSPIYLYFNLILRDPFQSLPIKQISLQIVTILLNYKCFRRIMISPTTNLIREIFRLMIQPAKNHPVHQEYEQLVQYLSPIAQFINDDRQFMEEIEGEIDGTQFILASFQQRIDLRVSSTN